MHRRDVSRALLASVAGSAALLPRQADAQATCGEPCYPRTRAEMDAQITPVSLQYVPGDVRRYGARGDGSTNDSPAIQQAIDASTYGSQKRIYIPATLPGYRISSTINVSGAVSICGDSKFNTLLLPASDIPVFSLSDGDSDVTISDLQIFGTGSASNTQPAILFTNNQYCVLERLYITRCGWGVRFAPGSVASYENEIHSCKINSNIVGNIDAGTNTNLLYLYNVQFGSAPFGVRIRDSMGLQIYGGDCEGCTTAGVDIDSTIGALPVNAIISGVDFEGNRTSGGNIRIGASGTIRGVTVVGCYFQPGPGDAYAINPLNCDSLTVVGCTQVGGYTAAVWINLSGNLTNLTTIGCRDSTGLGTTHKAGVGFAGIAAPAAVAGHAVVFLDSADGTLKVTFPNGTVRTLASP